MKKKETFYLNNLMRMLKNLALLLFYSFVFIGWPCLMLVNIITNPDRHHAQDDWNLLYIYGYLILVSPIIFIAPVKMAKFFNKIERLVFIILGLAAPYIGIYLSFKLNHISFFSGPIF